MFKRMSLSKKIWGILGLLAFAFVASTVLNISSLVDLQKRLHTITSVDVAKDQMISDIGNNQRQISIRVLESFVINDLEILKKNREDYLQFAKEQSERMAEFEKMVSGQDREIFTKYKDAFQRYMKNMDEARGLSEVNKNEEAVKIYLASDSIIGEMRKYLNELSDSTGKHVDENADEANSVAKRSVESSLFLSISSIIASLLLSYFVLRAVTGNINKIVKDLFDSSGQVNEASGQIASSSQELSQASTEQAASLEQTAAAIEELNSMVAKNSQNAESTAKISGDSQQKAEHGKEVVGRMINSMSDIDQSNSNIMTQVNKSNENMADIVKVIEEIGNKTKVINDIVFQTKLLSFNASVEAARAGEHGKGFAVVAEEVGNLAEMSGTAAKAISSMLEDSIRKVNAIVTDTKSSVEKLVRDGKQIVDNGTSVARECADVLDEIVRNVNDVASRAEEIATASQEQSRGVAEITKAMAQLDQVTQQNASVSEEAASAAEELSAQASSLKLAVGMLVTTVNGSNSDESEAPAPAVSNVVSMKKKSSPAPKMAPMKSTAAPKAQYKKIAGEVPAYDNEGFEDV